MGIPRVCVALTGTVACASGYPRQDAGYVVVGQLPRQEYKGADLGELVSDGVSPVVIIDSVVHTWAAPKKWSWEFLRSVTPDTITGSLCVRLCTLCVCVCVRVRVRVRVRVCACPSLLFFSHGNTQPPGVYSNDKPLFGPLWRTKKPLASVTSLVRL